MNQNELQYEEISLFDLWEKLVAGWKLLVGSIAASLLVAVVAVFMMTPEYEASAVVQLGQVGGNPIESVVQAVERMKSVPFQSRVAQSIGDDDWATRLQEFLPGKVKDLSVQGLKSSDRLIELKVRAKEQKEASRKAEAVIKQLVIVHDDLAKPTLLKMNGDLNIVKEKLAAAERDLQKLGKLVANTPIRDDRFTQLSLMTTVRLQKEADMFGQRQAIMALETALTPPATRPAKALESVFVSNTPVSPKKGLILALGSIGGLLVGILLVFFMDALCARRRARVV